MRRLVAVLACWTLCHPPPAPAAPCELTIPLTSPCAGLLVPAQDVRDCARGEAELAACVEHRRREAATCERTAEADRIAHTIEVAALVRERDAARARATAAEDQGGPSWWSVAAAGGVALAVGVVVGVLVGGAR